MRAASFWRRAGFPNPAALERAGYRTLGDLAGATREEFLAHSGLGEITLARCEALLGHTLPSYRAAWLRQGLPDPVAWRLSSLRIKRLEQLGDLAPSALRERGLSRQEITTLRRWAAGAAQDASPGHWCTLGLPPRIARVLDRAGIRSLEELAVMTREELLSLPGFPDGGVQRCEKLLGRPVPSAVAFWTGHGLPRVLAWRLSRHRVMNLDDLRRLTRKELEQLGLSFDEIRRLAARSTPD